MYYSSTQVAPNKSEGNHEKTFWFQTWRDLCVMEPRHHGDLWLPLFLLLGPWGLWGPHSNREIRHYLRYGSSQVGGQVLCIESQKEEEQRDKRVRKKS